MIEQYNLTHDILEVAANSPSAKLGVTSSTGGSFSALTHGLSVGTIDPVVIVSLFLTLIGLVLTGFSVYIGYQNLKLRRKEFESGLERRKPTEAKKMAVTITPADVKEIIKTALPDSFIAGLIATANKADLCLDGASVDDDIQRALKLSAVAHLIELQQRGSVSGESSPTGASRSYKALGSLDSTNYGQTVKALDEHGCLYSILQPVGGNGIYFRAVGK